MRIVRTKTNWLRVLALICLCLVSSATARASAATNTGGITLTPATLTIPLAPTERHHDTTFAVTNHYTVPVTLHFAATKSADNITTPLDVWQQLSFASANLVIGAGQTISQTVTLTDNDKLAPGSQLASIIVTQLADAKSQVGVSARMVMPIVTVKESGAISSLDRGSLQTPHLSWTLPKTVSVSVHNTGNMIAVPHGYVTVQTPNGRQVGIGAVNTASAAVSPGAGLTLNTPVIRDAHALWPGMYTLTFSYGLGHGQPVQVATARVLYIAWWHALILIGLAILISLGVRATAQVLLGKTIVRSRPPSLRAKKIRLVGKGTP